MLDAPAHPDASTPAGAQVRLDSLVADPKWGSRLTSGDPAAKLEFDLLSKKISGYGEEPRNDAVAQKALDAFMAAAADGKDPIVVEAAIRNAAGDTPPTAEEMIALTDRARHVELANEIIKAAGERFDLSPEIQAEIRNGSSATREQFDAVKKLHRQKTNDPAWGAKLLASDTETMRENFLFSLVLSREPDDQ